MVAHLATRLLDIQCLMHPYVKRSRRAPPGTREDKRQGWRRGRVCRAGWRRREQSRRSSFKEAGDAHKRLAARAVVSPSFDSRCPWLALLSLPRLVFLDRLPLRYSHMRCWSLLFFFSSLLSSVSFLCQFLLSHGLGLHAEDGRVPVIRPFSSQRSLSLQYSHYFTIFLFVDAAGSSPQLNKPTVSPSPAFLLL